MAFVMIIMWLVTGDPNSPEVEVINRSYPTKEDCEKATVNLRMQGPTIPSIAVCIHLSQT